MKKEYAKIKGQRVAALEILSSLPLNVGFAVVGIFVIGTFVGCGVVGIPVGGGAAKETSPLAMISRSLHDELQSVPVLLVIEMLTSMSGHANELPLVPHCAVCRSCIGVEKPCHVTISRAVCFKCAPIRRSQVGEL